MNTNLQLDWEISPIDVNYEFGKKQIFEIPLGFFNGSSDGAVSSVNGKFGDVVLTANDVGAVAKSELPPIKNELQTLENQVAQLEQNKLDKIDYVQHFRGVFTTLENLQIAVPLGVDGDYAHLDQGVGFDRTVAIWDTSDSKWVTSSASVGANTDEIPEGNTNLYFKSQRVLSSPLSGLTSGSNNPITGSDTILQALSKLQAQLDSRKVTWVSAETIGTFNNALGFGHGQINGSLAPLEFAKIDGQLWVRGFFSMGYGSGTGFTLTDRTYFVKTSSNFLGVILSLYSYRDVNGVRVWFRSDAPVNDSLSASQTSQYLVIPDNQQAGVYSIPPTCLGILI